jgi:predicted  nucleic acid-binding Zn-ribbon protein
MLSLAKGLGRTKIHNLEDLRQFFKQKNTSTIEFSIQLIRSVNGVVITETYSDIGTITLTKNDVDKAAKEFDDFKKLKAAVNKFTEAAAAAVGNLTDARGAVEADVNHIAANDKLKDAFKKLKDANDKLKDAFKKLKDANDTLKAANDTLKAANDKLTAAAQDEVKAAQEKVNDAQEKVKAAQDEVKAAQNEVKDAARDTIDNANMDVVISALTEVNYTTGEVKSAQEEVNDASTVLTPPRLFENIFKQSSNWDKTVTIPSAKLMGVENITKLYFLNEGADLYGDTNAFSLVYPKTKPKEFLTWRIRLMPTSTLGKIGKTVSRALSNGGTKYRRRTPRKSRKNRKSKKRR